MERDLEGNPLWQWVGKATELKAELEVIAQSSNIDVKSKSWPSPPSVLIRRLNEILHTLKDAGIKIEYDRGNGTDKENYGM